MPRLFILTFILEQPMSVKKITLAAAILLSLTACSSGGGSSSSNANKDQTSKVLMNEQLQAQISELQAKADAAQKKAEKAEQAASSAQNNAKEIEALKKEAATAKAEAEKAKQDAENALNTVDEKVKKALKQAEDERITAAKLREDNIQKLAKIARAAGIYEAEYLARQKSDLTEEQFTQYLQDRKKRYSDLKNLALENGFDENEAQNFANNNQDKSKEEVEELLNEWKESRIKQVELVKLAKENGLDETEAGNFAYENRDKGLTEAKTALEKRKAFIALAGEKGLDEQQAKEFARHNANLEQNEFIKQLDKRIAEEAFIAKLRYTDLGSIENLTITTPLGFTGQFEERTVPILDNDGFNTGKTRLEWSKDIYNQMYSLVKGRYSPNQEYDRTPTYRIDRSGLETLEKNLPLEGTATYQGVAFTHNKQGDLTYNVNFSTKEGEGRITNLKDVGELTLEKGSIGKRYDRQMSIAGNVAAAENWKAEGVSGKYLLDFYGPKAEEIAGTVELSQDITPRELTDGSGVTYIEKNKLSNVLTKYESYEDKFVIGFGGTRGEIQP